MLALVKRLRLSYMLYNFFHKKQLIYNETYYKKIGLNKKYYSPVSSKDFASVKNESFLKDESSVREKLMQQTGFKNLEDGNKKSVLDFHKQGFAVLKNFFDSVPVDNINKEIDFLIQSKKVKPLSNNKIMFAYKQSKLLNSVGNNVALKEILSALLGNTAILFQSINFYKGSEQHTHSDSIHMTTYPAGGLLGVWIALEDITDENGPLHYYPASHKLPYYMNTDYDNEGNKWFIGSKSYGEYEEMIEEKMKLNNMEKKIFYASKGDVLIWHANLFHGGEPHINKTKTRKSMVFHYFKEGNICYHEITQRPALITI